MLNPTLWTTSGCVIVLSILTATKAIAQNPILNDHVVKVSNKQFIDLKSPFFSENIPLNQLDDPHDFIKVNDWEMTSLPVEQLYPIPELNKSHKQDYHLVQEMVESEVTESESEERAWQFEFTPFAFVPINASGDSTVEGVTSDIDLDLGEILEILTFAASGRFEAWYKNQFGIIFEGIYLTLGDDGENIISGPRGLVDLEIGVDVSYKQAVFDLGFGYRIKIDDGDDDDKVSQAGLLDGYFDIIAGVRLQYLEQTAELNTELSGPFQTVGIDRDLGQDETWVEPLLGVRLSYQVSPRFAIGTRGDISGFGIDNLSTTWRVITGFDWVFSGNTSLKLGYEVYSIDYKTGDDEFGLDQFQHGPYLGVSFRF